jgi:2-keto-4-pentenoate hydratase/2-oxohepta-3-ene-1,7-dioic acid hydratase in catechol pathway
MKLARYGIAGAERPALLDADGNLRDLAGHIGDLDGAALAPGALAKLAQIDPVSLPKVQGEPRLGPPVGNIGKIVAIGLNYADHAAETGARIPDEPIIFMKACTATGPNDPVPLPRGCDKLDWEVELAIVIGTRARYVEKEAALAHVAGYTVCNDVSARDWQIERGGQWVKGKSSDGFAPLGPWLVTRDEVKDPQALDLWLDVNGEKMQRGSTKTMIFGVRHLVHYVSQFMTLNPGDIVTTGTPPGVGLGMKPPRFLKKGDEMRLGIGGFGEQRQIVTAD